MPSVFVEDHDGDSVEAAVAMLLCLDNPATGRRRPGRGDKGIDVFVSAGNHLVDVYQVKKHTTQLNASQWGKVRTSYDTLVTSHRRGEIAVRNWYLTMPKDATDKDEEAFAELTHDSPFAACAWRGLAFLDGLAGKYPEAVDYYLRNGRERLARHQEDLLRVLDARDAAPDGPATDAVSEGLAALHRVLNETDPHYRYDVAVGAHSARDAHIPAIPSDDLACLAQRSDGTTCVTWSMYARCAESVYERPVPVSVTLTGNGDPAFAEQPRMFVEYGKPLIAPAGTNVFTMDLPGGLGGQFDNGTFTIGPTVEQQHQTHQLRLRTTSPDGTARTCTVTMQAATVGFKGAWLVGTHDGGAFDVEFLHDFATESASEAMHLSFTAHDATGMAAVAAIEGAQFVASLPGAELAVAGPHGPFLASGGVPESAGEPSTPDPIIEAFELLARIQNHTPVTVLVPDLSAT